MKKRIILAATLIGLLTFFYNYFKADNSPIFFKKDETTSLVEMIAQPASDIYGSSINVWIYRDSANRIKEVAVTGHADSKTCSQMSALFFNSYLQKYEDTNDFFVAGAGRLVNNIDEKLLKALESKDKVTLYKKRDDEKKEIEFFIKLLSDPRSQAYSNKSTSAIKQYQMKLQAIEEKLKELEEDMDVKSYKKIKDTDETLSALVKETIRLAENSGLIQVHNLKANIIKTVDERLLEHIKKKDKKTIQFTDILTAEEHKEGIVWVNTYRLDKPEPIVIQLPIENISKESFEKAKEENRNELEISMVGDAKRRIDFFYDQKLEINNQEHAYSALPKSALKERIHLNQCISPDGFVYDCPGSYITKEEYLTVRIPQLKKFMQTNIEDLELTIKDIEQDKKRESEDSRIENLNHMTLVDAMLRNWNLPVGTTQKAFDKWKIDYRENIWQLVEKELGKMNIPVKALSGENIVFSVRLKDKMLEIRPMQVLDLAHAIIVLDPKMYISRVESSWSQREKQFVDKETKVVETDKVPAFVSTEIQKIAQKNTSVNSSEVLIQLLNNFPTETIAQLETYFYQTSVATNNFNEALLESVKPMVQKKELINAFSQLQSDPRYESDEILYLNDYTNFLSSYPVAPLDFHLRHAIRLANLLAEVEKQKGGNLTAWEVIEKCENSNDAFNNISEFLQSKTELHFLISAEIRAIMKLIEERDITYYKLVQTVKGYPKEPSQEFKQLFKTNEKVSLMQNDAQNYLLTFNKLTNYSFGDNAAYALKMYESPNINSIINELNKATLESQTSKNLYFMSAVERLKRNEAHNNDLDNLARIQTYATVNRGCELILKEINQVNQHTNRAINGYNQIYSRFLYESKEYGASINSLFDSLTPIMAYHPQLSWKVSNEDWVSVPYPNYVKSYITGNTLIIKASKNNKEVPILELSNIPQTEMSALCQYVNELPIKLWRSDGKVSDKILMAKVPLRAELKNILSVLYKPEIKLALIKAMVYSIALPATNIITPSGSNKIEIENQQNKDRLNKPFKIKYPSLEVLEKHFNNLK